MTWLSALMLAAAVALTAGCQEGESAATPGTPAEPAVESDDQARATDRPRARAQQVPGDRTPDVGATRDADVTQPAAPGPMAEPEARDLIQKALAGAIGIEASRIRVAVEGATVVLDGSVRTLADKRLAAEVAGTVPGVDFVDNRIDVEPRARYDDRSVGRRVARALRRAALVDPGGVEIEVAGGRVVLRGVVDSPAERQQAANQAEQVPGVIALDNRLEVSGEVARREVERPALRVY